MPLYEKSFDLYTCILCSNACNTQWLGAWIESRALVEPKFIGWWNLVRQRILYYTFVIVQKWMHEANFIHSQFFRIDRTLVFFWISYSKLAGITTVWLQRYLPNMNVIWKPIYRNIPDVVGWWNSRRNRLPLQRNARAMDWERSILSHTSTWHVETYTSIPMIEGSTCLCFVLQWIKWIL